MPASKSVARPTATTSLKRMKAAITLRADAATNFAGCVEMSGATNTRTFVGGKGGTEIKQVAQLLSGSLHGLEAGFSRSEMKKEDSALV